ncbi:MAG: hypothetical protein ABI175_21260, partial [Polyangiales bacterium]
MADDPKKNDDEKLEGEGSDDKSAKKPYGGESQESVTKIERRKTESGPPKSGDPAKSDDDGSIEKAAAKAAEDAGSDEPTVKPPSVKPGAKKTIGDDDDVEPTGAQTPIAKGVKPGDKKAPAAAAKKADDDDDDEDEVPVRRPASKTATTGKGAPATAATRKAAGGGGGGGGGGGSRPTGGEGQGKRRRASAESGGLILLLAGFLVVGNMALKGVASTRLDATKDERYSLSKKGTAHLLSTLKKPLNIKVFAPEGLATIDAFVRDLRDLLSEYV